MLTLQNFTKLSTEVNDNIWLEDCVATMFQVRKDCLLWIDIFWNFELDIIPNTSLKCSTTSNTEPAQLQTVFSETMQNDFNGMLFGPGLVYAERFGGLRSLYIYIQIFCAIFRTQLYNIKYSYLNQTICTQMYGFKYSHVILIIIQSQIIIFFNNSHLFAHNYLVPSK